MAPAKPEWRAFAGLCATGFVVLMSLPLLTRNIHFVIDDWEFLQLPFYNDTIHSVIGAIYRKLRVSREIYMTLESKLLRMDRHAMMYVSVSLHWLNAVLFGAALLQAFPNHPRFSLAATGLAMSFPPLLTFTFFAIDSTRIPLTLIFASALFLQGWARTQRHLLLVMAGGAYFLAQTFYENTIFFALLLPCAALPILLERQGGLFTRHVLLKSVFMYLGIGVSGVVFLFYRNVLGFIDTSRTGMLAMPSARLVNEYLSSTLWYLLKPIFENRLEIWACAAGLALSVALAFFLVKAPGRRAETGASAKTWALPLVAILFGAVLYFLGILPYLLIDYSVSPAWTIETRILSSAGYGLFLLLAVPFLFPLRGLAATVAILVIGGLVGAWLSFGHASRQDWQEAADRHCLMWNSLLQQVPYVSEGTAFLFDDLRVRNDHAIVFGGSDSVQVLVGLLYKRPGITDHVFGYNLDERVLLREHGLETSRSQAYQGGPIPLDSLILVRRQGDKLVVVNSFTPEIAVSTNRNRIVQPPQDSPGDAERLARLSIRCPR